jgi:NCAIR mutase (PurE)-related protein
MSRSRKKEPFSGITTAKSEKEDKRIFNRIFRRQNKQILSTSSEEKLKEVKEVINPWNMDKDGKTRFDPDKHPDEMRK